MLPHNVGKSLKKSLIFTISKNNLATQIGPILAQNSKLGGTRKKSDPLLTKDSYGKTTNLRLYTNVAFDWLSIIT